MAALKDKAISLLGTATLTMTTGAGGTIYTTPVGKITRITHIIFRNPSASMAAGTNMSVNGFAGTISLVNLVTANTGYVVCQAGPAAATPQAPVQATEVAAATNVALTITTGAAAGTCTVDVFGFTDTV